MKALKNSAGFTLIELVLVIAMLGILAVTALPNLFDVNLANARSSSRDAVVGAVQAGLSLYGANEISNGDSESYPPFLETTDVGTNIAASRTVPLFNSVLQGGVGDQWAKLDNDCYAYDADGDNAAPGDADDDEYQYIGGTTGTFLGIADCN